MFKTERINKYALQLDAGNDTSKPQLVLWDYYKKDHIA